MYVRGGQVEVPALDADLPASVLLQTSRGAVGSAIAALPLLGGVRAAAVRDHTVPPVHAIREWAMVTGHHQRLLSRRSQCDTFRATVSRLLATGDPFAGQRVARLRSTTAFESFCVFDSVPSRKEYEIADGPWARAANKRMPGSFDPSAAGLPTHCPSCPSNPTLAHASHLDVCRARGRPTLVHDALRNVVQRASRGAGMPAALEQRHLVPTIGSGRARPGDVTVTFPGDTRECVDVTRSSFSPSQRRANAMADAIQPRGASAAAAEAAKAAKLYVDMVGQRRTMSYFCRAQGLGYQPVAVDNVGAWGPNMSNLLNRLGEQAHVTLGMPAWVYKSAWTRSIAITMVNSQGAVAAERICDLVGRTSGPTRMDPEDHGLFDIRGTQGGGRAG